MKMFALTIPLLLAASPVAAQQQQALGAGGQINNSTLPNTGLICIQEMVATFCNLPVGPNNAGYGSSTAFSGSSARSGTSAGSGSSAPERVWLLRSQWCPLSTSGSCRFPAACVPLPVSPWRRWLLPSWPLSLVAKEGNFGSY